MAYLRWSNSPWYVYASIDGGVGDDALLAVRHLSGWSLDVTAAELRRAEISGQPERLLALMRAAMAPSSALDDAETLLAAVDQFLLETYSAGLVPMPPEIARRYRVLRRLVRRSARRPKPAQASGGDDYECPNWARWMQEMIAIDAKYPPPPMPEEIKKRLAERSRRFLVSWCADPAQDAILRALQDAWIDSWPPKDTSQKGSKKA